MPRRTPNRALAAVLAEARWSAGELARAVNAEGARSGIELHYDRTAVAHWLQGSRPRAPVPDLVARVLGNRTRRPLRPGDLGLTQLAQELLPGPPGDADAVGHLVALCRDDADPVRRGALARAVYTLTSGETMLWRATGSAVPPSPRGARPAGASDVIALQEMVRVFALLTWSHGGAHARSALACYLSDDVGRLLHAPAPAVLRPQLFTLAAELTHLLAAMTADAGHHGLAQHYFHTALLLAREADDRANFAITLRAMSVQALTLGRRRHAADLAQAAADALAPTDHPAACSYVLAQRALTHATQQHVRGAEADLAAAERWHDQAGGPPGPFTAYPRAALDYQRAEALFALGRTGPALRAFEDSLRSRGAGQRKAHALTEARVAETTLALGHLDAACAHWHTFLDQYPALRSDQADQALARMRSSLASFPRHALAQAVRERSRAVVGPSAAP